LLLATTIASATDATPPPVDAMNCDQMRLELVDAGAKMKSQLDPAFAKEAEAMRAEMQASPGAMAVGTGMSIACSVPGIDMFCMTAQYAQGMAQAGQATQNLERMQAQVERIQRAMEGIDIERMEALSQRFEQQKCEVPQQ
jgi:hypothetical protein